MSSSACNALKFFSVESSSVKLQFTIDIFFKTAVLRKLFDIRFSYKHSNFSRVCLLVKMASKTVTRSICLPNTKPTQTSLQTNRKQSFKKDFPQHSNDTTPPSWLNEIGKVLLFQDIFHVLVCQSIILHFDIWRLSHVVSWSVGMPRD